MAQFIVIQWIDSSPAALITQLPFLLGILAVPTVDRVRRPGTSQTKRSRIQDNEVTSELKRLGQIPPVWWKLCSFRAFPQYASRPKEVSGNSSVLLLVCCSLGPNINLQHAPSGRTYIHTFNTNAVLPPWHLDSPSPSVNPVSRQPLLAC